jgi:hypothetical protein
VGDDFSEIEEGYGGRKGIPAHCAQVQFTESAFVLLKITHNLDEVRS